MPAQQQMRNEKPVTRFHVMAKPFGPVCNLDCDYCYYLSKENLLSTQNKWRMSDEVLEAFIKQYIEQQNYDEIVFSWQGGEPTLLGIDFFKKVVELEKKYCPPDKKVENDLQTNCTLLDDEWCEFLAANNFLVGVSIDGPKKLHDKFRTYKDGRGTFDDIMRAVKLLKKHNARFATLTVINRENAKRPLDVYRFLTREIGSKRLQFIPIVEPKVFRNIAPQHWDREMMPMLGSSGARPGTPDSVVEDWCVDPDDWGYFLCKVFDDWHNRDLGKIYVHYFDAAVEVWMGRVNPLCTQAPMCGKGLAIEHDGTVYACDHYVYPEYARGNILNEKLEDMIFTSEQEYFGTNKERMLPNYCRQCPYLFACFGECPKNRFLRTPDGQGGLNYLCSGWKKFYAHIDDRVCQIVKNLGEHVAVPRKSATS